MMIKLPVSQTILLTIENVKNVSVCLQCAASALATWVWSPDGGTDRNALCYCRVMRESTVWQAGISAKVIDSMQSYNHCNVIPHLLRELQEWEALMGLPHVCGT